METHMPLFGGRQRPSQEEQEAAEVDLERIRAGGIPLGAEQRLERIGAAKTPFFTSDLSAKEYALAQASGLQPVAQVMGSSVVKHGYQNYGWANYNYGGITELTAFSDPWNLSRTRAFGRLSQEAELAGADAVIGIELTTNSVSDSRSDVEYVVFGTAVRETTLLARPQSGPRLCALSGQDVDKLRRIGAEIRGVLGHTTVVCVTLSWQAGQAMRMWSGNQELIEITQGIYEARRLVMAEILRQARDVRANDVVISTLSHDINHVEYEQAGYGTQHVFIITMHVLGTAVALGAHEPHPAPLHGPMLSIDLRG
jgi:uncharacterized protein YbjQ (UPF0145 family)